MRAHLASVALLAALASACEKKDQPPPSAPEAPAGSASAADSASAAPSAAASVSPAAKRPLEIFNGCQDVATLLFGEDPKSPTAKRTVASGATITDAPRNNDGTQTVFLLDMTGTPLVHVEVKKQMKRIEVGRSCRTLDAR